MDSTVAAALLGGAVAGLGGLLVPRMIALVPPWEPPPPEESGVSGQSEEHQLSEADGTVDATDESAEAPEPYADIAALPGLAWKSAVVCLMVGVVVGVA